MLLDSTVAYLSMPGTVEEFAHPVAGGDACTVIALSPSLLGQLAGGDPFLSVPALPMDVSAEIAARRLNSLAGGEDSAGLVTELAVRLIATVLARCLPERSPAEDPLPLSPDGGLSKRRASCWSASRASDLSSLPAGSAAEPTT